MPFVTPGICELMLGNDFLTMLADFPSVRVWNLGDGVGNAGNDAGSTWCRRYMQCEAIAR